MKGAVRVHGLVPYDHVIFEESLKGGFNVSFHEVLLVLAGEFVRVSLAVVIISSVGPRARRASVVVMARIASCRRAVWGIGAMILIGMGSVAILLESRVGVSRRWASRRRGVKPPPTGQKKVSFLTTIWIPQAQQWQQEQETILYQYQATKSNYRELQLWLRRLPSLSFL
jgi:hypothetical protein